jgi:hypothetical protein
MVTLKTIELRAGGVWRFHSRSPTAATLPRTSM